ncbi:MAG TPA: hypothetical protein VFR24_14550 [Candidatus Angelobacter sp.]|nr:hypothetical protein [Candidatus Angelobacter sp.]
MIAPGGQESAYVPTDQVQKYLDQGAEPGIRMTAPDGKSKAIVPYSQQDAYQKKGATWDAHPDNQTFKDTFDIDSDGNPVKRTFLGHLGRGIKNLFTDASPESGEVHITSGGQTRTVIVPKPGESFDDTMKRAAARAATPEGQADVEKSKIAEKDFAIGGAKSAGQTGVKLLRLPTTLHLAPKDPASDAMLDDWEKKLQPSNEDQESGQDVETVLEYISGDEALKGLSITEKLAHFGKVAKFLEEYPRLANIIGNTLRGATVGGTVGGIHHGTEGAIKGAEAGGLFEGGTSALGELSDAAGNAISDFRASRGAAAPEVVPDQPGVIKQAMKGEKVAQPATQGAVKKAVSNVAEEEGVVAGTKPSIRDSVEEVGDQVYAKSKNLYRELDEASGGTWQRFDDKIRAINQRMRTLDPDLDNAQWENLETAKNEALVTQQNTIDQLVKEGKITPDMGQQASATYKRSQALYDLDKAVKVSTKGIRPDIAEKGATPETIDPKMLSQRLNKMYDSGRLQEALGEDGAKEIINEMDAASRLRMSAISKQAMLRHIRNWAIGGAATALGGGAAYKVYKALE